MTYLVCKEKGSGRLFIVTRAAREAMLKMISALKMQPESIVLKTFPTYGEADRYKNDIEAADRTINGLI